jgi:hypothetical protein
MPTFSLPQPQYGCLKGGRLPLYKQYTRRQYGGVTPTEVPVAAPMQAPLVGQGQTELVAPSLAPTSNVKHDIIQKKSEHINISDL